MPRNYNRGPGGGIPTSPWTVDYVLGNFGNAPEASGDIDLTLAASGTQDLTDDQAKTATWEYRGTGNASAMAIVDGGALEVTSLHNKNFWYPGVTTTCAMLGVPLADLFESPAEDDELCIQLPIEPPVTANNKFHTAWMIQSGTAGCFWRWLQNVSAVDRVEGAISTALANVVTASPVRFVELRFRLVDRGGIVRFGYTPFAGAWPEPGATEDIVRRTVHRVSGNLETGSGWDPAVAKLWLGAGQDSGPTPVPVTKFTGIRALRLTG